MKPYEFIIHCRKMVNFSQFELSEVIKVSLPTISRWERGETEPSFSILEKIASATGCEINLLLANPPPSEDGSGVESNLSHLEEGERAVSVLAKVCEIVNSPLKVAKLMKDYAENGQVDCEEFKAVFNELREVVNEARV